MSAVAKRSSMATGFVKAPASRTSEGRPARQAPSAQLRGHVPTASPRRNTAVSHSEVAALTALAFAAAKAGSSRRQGASLKAVPEVDWTGSATGWSGIRQKSILDVEWRNIHGVMTVSSIILFAAQISRILVARHLRRPHPKGRAVKPALPVLPLRFLLLRFAKTDSHGPQRATKESVKLGSFHEARFNFFLYSVQADPTDFEDFVDHERSKRFPGAQVQNSMDRTQSAKSFHARPNTVHPTWKPEKGLSAPPMALIIQCESFVAHQAPTELEVWLTAMVYIPWIFFCWRDSEQLENHYAVTFYASCGWAFMSLSSLFSVLYQEKYPDFALGILLFGNFVFALACLYFYGYHWTRMWRHFTQNRFRPLWIPGLLGLMCLHLLTPLDLMKRLDDPGWWKTVCSVYNDEWWWVADVRIIELFVTAAALLLIILHIQGVFTGMKNAAVVALALVRVISDAFDSCGCGQLATEL
eukprot:s1418_g15.t2